MRLLPSEQKERIEKSIAELEANDCLSIFEPCNCGSQVMHNNSGNYHSIIDLRKDTGKFYVKYEATCELVPPAEWQECENPKAIIKENADWL